MVVSRPSGPQCSQSLWALRPQGPGPSLGEVGSLSFPQQCPGATAGENTALGSVGLGVHMGRLGSHRTYGNETAHKQSTDLPVGWGHRGKAQGAIRGYNRELNLEDLQKLKAKGGAGTGGERELCILLVVVQSLSRVWLSATPWTAAPQASLSFSVSRSLLKLMSIESVMPSNLLIFCRLLLLLSLIFLCLNWSLNLAACP